MTKFDKIKEIVKEYQKDLDSLFEKYAREEQNARSRFSESAFQTEFMLNVYPKFAGTAHAKAEIARDEAMFYFKEIEKEFREWTLKPVDSAILQTLGYIRNFDLQLTMQELQIIEQGILGSYFGTKIFAAIARNNGFQVDVVKVDDFMDSFELAKSTVEMAIMAYAGHAETGFPGRDLIEHNVVNGVDYGEFPVWQLALASEFCTKNNNSLADAERLWNESKAPVKYTLTQDEQKRLEKEINQIVDGFGMIDREKADKLLETTPDILSRLDSMSDCKYKELAQHYYALGRIGQEKEESKSMINPAVQQAAEYANQNGQVNEDILNHYA